MKSLPLLTMVPFLWSAFGLADATDVPGTIDEDSGGRIVVATDGDSHTDRFLSVSDASIGAFHHILEIATPFDPTGYILVEADNYYIDRRWTIADHDACVTRVGDGRMVVVRGSGSAFSVRKNDGETEIEPLEVICCEMR